MVPSPSPSWLSRLASICVFGTEVEGNCVANKEAIVDLGVTTGSAPNDILLLDNSLFIVNSIDNSIQKVDLSDKSENKTFISLPVGSNPYYMTIDNNELFVSNLMGNSYSRAMLNDAENVKTVSFEGDNALKGPEGIAVTSDSIFITNTNSYWDNDAFKMVYGDGFITLVNKADDTFNKMITTSQKNPQRAIVLGDKLYVINSGISEFIENVAHPKSDSGIDVLDLTNIDAGFTNTEIPFTDGEMSGFVGSYSLNNDNTKMFLASGSSPELYSYDITNNSMLRNTDNPIVIDSDLTGSVMLNLATVEQYLFIVNFNNDTLYILDTENDYKLILKADIGADSETLEGAQGITYDKENKKVYVFFGLSKQLISIDIEKL